MICKSKTKKVFNFCIDMSHPGELGGIPSVVFYKFCNQGTVFLLLTKWLLFLLCRLIVAVMCAFKIPGFNIKKHILACKKCCYLKM